MTKKKTTKNAKAVSPEKATKKAAGKKAAKKAVKKAAAKAPKRSAKPSAGAAYVVKVPLPPKKAYNPERPVAEGSLLSNQVQHFRKIEMKMAKKRQTGMDTQAILTEGHAAEYLRQMTEKLHPEGAPVQPGKRGSDA